MDGCGLGCVVPRHAKVAAQSGKLDLKATRVQNAGVPSCLGTRLQCSVRAACQLPASPAELRLEQEVII